MLSVNQQTDSHSNMFHLMTPAEREHTIRCITFANYLLTENTGNTMRSLTSGCQKGCDLAEFEEQPERDQVTAVEHGLQSSMHKVVDI